MGKNRAAWLLEPHGQLQVRDGPEAQLGEKDVLIENKAVAINPVDWKVQDMDGFVKEYPTVLGSDVAGIVADVGSAVTKVKKGDRALGLSLSLSTGVVAQAGFQQYTVVPEVVVSPVPEPLSDEEAAVIPLGVSTAAAGLYQKDALALPYPKSGNSKPSEAGSIFITGGSSSVGLSAIQLAVASGLQVATACSKKNFDLVKGVGAAHVFDYNDASIVENVVKALQGTKLVGAYDAIGDEKTYKTCGAIVESFGGGMVAGTVPIPAGIDLGKNVVGKSVFALTIALKEPEVGNAIFQHFLPEALASGQYVAKPDPKVVGHGLESIQDAINAQKAGVSATKLIVTL